MTLSTLVPAQAATIDPDYGWHSAELDLPAYLARLGHDDVPAPTLATLRALHRAHAAAIPFENLDILLGAPIDLDVPALQRKLVTGRRGGYCYEHNLLFAAVLEQVGFRVTGLAARIRNGDARLRPVSHALLAVEVDGVDWLADVGFGGEGLLEPVPLADGVEVTQGVWTFRLDSAPHGDWVLRSRHADGWFDLYAFRLEPRFRPDFALFNHYTATHPRSPFVRRVVVQRTGPEVRHVLLGRTLMATRGTGAPERRELAAAELPAVLRDVFGIVLDGERDQRLVRIVGD